MIVDETKMKTIALIPGGTTVLYTIASVCVSFEESLFQHLDETGWSLDSTQRRQLEDTQSPIRQAYLLHNHFQSKSQPSFPSKSQTLPTKHFFSVTEHARGTLRAGLPKGRRPRPSQPAPPHASRHAHSASPVSLLTASTGASAPETSSYR